MNSMARRIFELVEPIGVIPYSADEPNGREMTTILRSDENWGSWAAGSATPCGAWWFHLSRG
jgi:hypothetical protein